MIKPYTAVGLIPTVRGIRKRKDIKINLEHLSHLVKAASWLSSLDLPVRLIAFPEGALQAFNDEVLDLDHATFARECAIDIPGEETEALGKIAKEYNAFVMAQAKARHPDLKDRFFNVGFIINPRARVERRRGRVPRLLSPPGDRQRDLRDPEPRPRARQQHVRRRAEHGDLLPLSRGGDPDRHVRGPFVHHRLQGADRGPPGLRRRLDVRGRRHRRRGPPRPPGPGPVGQLDEGSQNRALPAPVRAADLPEEPLPQARADEARRVPLKGDQAPDPAHARPRHLEEARPMRTPLLVLALVLAPWPAAAELLLPAGFSAQVYVTGEGFDSDAARGIRGFPSISTLTFDQTGALYLARSGRRYIGGEVYDRSLLYRIPVGGARLTPDTVARYFYGPPLPNPQVAV